MNINKLECSTQSCKNYLEYTAHGRTAMEGEMKYA